MVDLRSDTLTKPTPAMREAMIKAEVGDDVYGEDPTVNALQEYAAKLLEKESALFVPSGSMANQIALLAHTRPGDDVIIGQGAHNYLYESGAGGAISNVQFSLVGQGGLFTVEDASKEFKVDNHHFAPTRLICIENTHNRGGGKVFPLAEVKRLRAFSRAQHIPLHMDGARLFNAQVAASTPAKAWTNEVDSLSICLSKGLGAPVGSLLLGSKDFIWRCHRYRKMLGGGMRQAGILAAAGLFALQHNIERLSEDHRRATVLANGLAQEPKITLLEKPQSNIVIYDLGVDAAAYVAEAKKEGVLLNSIGAQRVRLVTHLDVDDAGIEKAISVLTKLARSL